jgi:phosphatidylserine/phosphatidylglycerophosphate/cardiolipin synthase-like enzyme
MFKMTDEKSAKMVKALASLQKRGCDVQILMSRSYGSTVFSKAVLKTLKSAKIPFKCAAFPMHTKLILIGPKYGNSGRILTGTANMSVAGLRYSEEHVITIDTRRAVGEYQESAKRLFGEYMTQWYELSQGGRSCK